MIAIFAVAGDFFSIALGKLAAALNLEYDRVAAEWTVAWTTTEVVIMNHRLLYMILIAAFSFPAFAAPQATPQSASASTAQHPQLRCATCDGGGDTPPPPPAQAGKITFFNISPQYKTVEIRDSTGLVAVINPQANTVSLSRSGRTSQVSYNAALLQWSGGDSTKAAAMQARFQALLANPKNTSMLAPSVVPQSSLNTNGVLKPNNGLKPSLMAGPGGETFSCDIDFDCDVIYDGDFGGWGGYDLGFWADAGGGGTGTSDYNYWHIWQQDHCGSATHEAWQAVAGYTVVVATCATSEFGVTALACAGSLVATADVMASHGEDSAICDSSYPGVGNWGG